MKTPINFFQKTSIALALSAVFIPSAWSRSPYEDHSSLPDLPFMGAARIAYGKEFCETTYFSETGTYNNTLVLNGKAPICKITSGFYVSTSLPRAFLSKGGMSKTELDLRSFEHNGYRFRDYAYLTPKRDFDVGMTHMAPLDTGARIRSIIYIPSEFTTRYSGYPGYSKALDNCVADDVNKTITSVSSLTLYTAFMYSHKTLVATSEENTFAINGSLGHKVKKIGAGYEIVKTNSSSTENQNEESDAQTITIHGQPQISGEPIPEYCYIGMGVAPMSLVSSTTELVFTRR